MDDEPVYDPSMPMGSPILQSTTTTTTTTTTQLDTPSAISTPPVLAQQIVPSPTDAGPSAASYSAPDFVLPGLREDVAEVVVEENKEEANEGQKDVEHVKRDTPLVEEPSVGSEVESITNEVYTEEEQPQADMEMVASMKDDDFEDQTDIEPLPRVDEEMENQLDTEPLLRHVGEEDEDAEGQVDLEMDVIGDSDAELPGLTDSISATIIEPLPAIKEEVTPTPTPTSTTTTPPPSRRPRNLQRRSPVYDTSTPPSIIPAAAPPAYSLPPKPTDVVATSAYELNHRRSSSNTPSTGVQRTIASLPPTTATTATPAKGRTAREKGWEGVVWPEGLSKDSPSVKRFPGLVENWIDSDQSPQSLLALFEASCSDGEIIDARSWFGSFQKDNPTATRPLLDLINLELAHNNFGEVVKLFEKALRGLGGSVGAVPGVDIWKSYLHYIRRQNPIPTVNPSSPTSASQQAAADKVRESVRAAYELSLKECGNDVDSGDIWKEYIGFLGEREGTTSWEVQQQQDAIRAVYQRVVVVPVGNVETMWREYDQFENKLNKVTAKKFLAERSPAYMTARKALRELKQHVEALSPSVIPPRPTWVESDRALAIHWKKYLKWEESNPLDIEDAAGLQARVIYAMRKCLTQMRFFPELWFHVASYLQSQGRLDEAGAYLKTGVDANPHSFLLTFAYAEYEEAKKNNAAAHAAYEHLLKEHSEAIEKARTSVEKEAQATMGPEIPIEDDAPKDEDIEMIGAGPTGPAKARIEREARGQTVRSRRAKEIEDLVTAGGIIWVMYMRFVRRAEGMKSARVLFGTARKSPCIAWQVYESAASMEYVCNNQSSIATKIFELGLKAFPDEVALAVKFLQFQLQINDEANARALFERLVLKFAPDKARPVWDLWAKHEYTYGDLAACQKMEARFAEAYPSESPLKRFASRYIYQGIDQILLRDLGFGAKTSTAAAPTVSSVPVKRPLPDDLPASPRIPEPRYRDDRPPPPRGDLPMKRPRPLSPPPRERERWPAPPPPENGWGQRRELSPPPRRVEVRGPPPPAPMPPSEPLDRSGLPKTIVWFLGNLPSARTFDGPLFRPDDLMSVLATQSLPGGSRTGPDLGYRGPSRR